MFNHKLRKTKNTHTHTQRVIYKSTEEKDLNDVISTQNNTHYHSKKSITTITN